MRALTRLFIASLFVACGDSDEGTKTDTSQTSETATPAETSVSETSEPTEVTEPVETSEPTEVAETSEPTDTSEPTEIADTEDGDTVEPSGCDPYPVAVFADPDAKARAATALAALAPAATMTWNDNRGTLQSVAQLNHAMPECTDGQDFGVLAMQFVEAHPDIFQFDLSEWQDRGSLPCTAVNENIDFFTYGRATIGGHEVRKDVFTLIAIRVDGVVTLRGINAFYLPKTTPELTAKLDACPDLDTAAALAVIGKSELPYSTYNQCVPNGEGTYLAHDDDTIEFDSGSYWLWDDSPDGGVRFEKYTDARLIVAEANRTAELLSSDANCPAEPPETGRIIGFRITFDAVTGALVVSFPGIGCIVC